MSEIRQLKKNIPLNYALGITSLGISIKNAYDCFKQGKVSDGIESIFFGYLGTRIISTTRVLSKYQKVCKINKDWNKYDGIMNFD